MGDMIDRGAAIQAVFDWEQGKISGTIADAIATLPAASHPIADDARRALEADDVHGWIKSLPAASSEDVRAGAQAQAREAWRIAGMVTKNDEAMQVHQAICALFKIDTAKPDDALITGAKP